MYDEFRNADLPQLRPGYYGLIILYDVSMRGDTDNRIKLLSDVVKTPNDKNPKRLGIVEDDKFMRPLYVDFAEGVGEGRVSLVLASMEDGAFSAYMSIMWG